MNSHTCCLPDGTVLHVGFYPYPPQNSKDRPSRLNSKCCADVFNFPTVLRDVGPDLGSLSCKWRRSVSLDSGFGSMVGLRFDGCKVESKRCKVGLRSRVFPWAQALDVRLAYCFGRGCPRFWV